MKNSKPRKDGFFVKFSHFFFRYSLTSLFFWLVLIFASVVIYTNIIKKEGFPSIEFPVTIINGQSLNENSSVNPTDEEIVKPIIDQIITLSDVQTVNATTGNNSFQITVQFEENVEAEIGTQQIQNVINKNKGLTENINLEYITFNPAKLLLKYDVLLSLYSTEEYSSLSSENQKESLKQLEDVALLFSQAVSDSDEISLVEPQNLLDFRKEEITEINKVGISENNKLTFYPSIVIGVAQSENSNLDTLKFSEHLNQQIDTVDLKKLGEDYHIKTTYDFADVVIEQIDSLESNLGGALIAVMIVSFLLISWRASIITALFMISTVLTTIAIMYIAGLSLNVITLFSLIVALGLFVDDATIIVEVLESHKRKFKDNHKVVKKAIKRVAKASFSGTITTVLVFVPLLFVTGILGEFIRVMPITIIIALFTSFILSLILIPIISKYLILKQKKLDWLTRNNPISKIESIIANFLARRVYRINRPGMINKLFPVWTFIIAGFMFFSGLSLFAQVDFNIFPPSKDSNYITYNIKFPSDYVLLSNNDANSKNIDASIDEINQIIANTLKQDGLEVNYFEINAGRNGTGGVAVGVIELSHYQNRQLTASELSEKIKLAFKENLSDQRINISLAQDDQGPPVEEFPISIQVFSEDIETAKALIVDMNEQLASLELETSNGGKVTITETRLPLDGQIQRIDDKKVTSLGLKFDETNISPLLQPVTNYIEKNFNDDYLSKYNLKSNDIDVNAGAEEDNVESFNLLVIMFPIIILATCILLILHFRSFLQASLIMLAIPFTFFGVASGLIITDNALGFFTMLGITSLIGIAINNTILFTDYANQELRKGRNIYQAVAIATRDRFRPLVTTSVTTIVALLPLALNDPFWQALAYTIIFGLLSSTFLVILVFPYCFMLIEYLRQKVRRKKKA